MAEYANDKLGVRFTVADKITVRKQLAYAASRQFKSDSDTFEAYWRAALLLIEGWACDRLPDPQKVDLDAVDDPEVTHLIIWAAGQVAGHVSLLGAVPKV